MDPNPQPGRHLFADDKPKCIWATLSTFSWVWAFICKLTSGSGSGSASGWKFGSESTSNKNPYSHAIPVYTLGFHGMISFLLCDLGLFGTLKWRQQRSILTCDRPDDAVDLFMRVSASCRVKHADSTQRLVAVPGVEEPGRKSLLRNYDLNGLLCGGGGEGGGTDDVFNYPVKEH